MNNIVKKIEDLAFALKRWEHHIQAALDHGENAHALDHVVDMILTGKVLFFSYDSCFVIMEKISYPQYSVFHCFLAGGDLEGVLKAQEPMLKLGKELGCKYLSMAGRNGWIPSLKKAGWNHLCTTMYLEIPKQGTPA